MEKMQWMERLSDRTTAAQVMKTNTYTEQFGLTLTQEEADLLLEERKKALLKEKRVEFGESILPKLICCFCDSDYLEQESYARTLIRLQDIFFRYKNEMQDEITDDELLHFMREQFDNVCFGSLDYLEGTCLEIFAEAVRAGYRDYQRTEGKGVYKALDEVTRWDKEPVSGSTERTVLKRLYGRNCVGKMMMEESDGDLGKIQGR